MARKRGLLDTYQRKKRRENLQDTFNFILEFVAKNGFGPLQVDIRKSLRFSTVTVGALLDLLVTRNMVVKVPEGKRTRYAPSPTVPLPSTTTPIGKGLREVLAARSRSRRWTSSLREPSDAKELLRKEYAKWILTDLQLLQLLKGRKAKETGDAVTEPWAFWRNYDLIALAVRLKKYPHAGKALEELIAEVRNAARAEPVSP